MITADAPTRSVPAAPRPSDPDPLRWRDPVRLFWSAAPWRSWGLLLTYVFTGSLAFSLALGVLIVGGVLSITWVGLPVLVLALGVVRGMSALERGRFAAVGPAIDQPQRRPVRRGLLSGLRDRLRDGASWREIAYFIVAWPYLLALDLIAITVAFASLYLVSLPFWYRFPWKVIGGVRQHGVEIGYYPNGAFRGPHYGFFIRDMHSALGACGAGLVLFVLVGTYLLVGVARHHRLIADALLGDRSTRSR